MRIAFTSDLHADLDPRNEALLEVLAARVVALAPDVLVLAGDLAETVADVTRSLLRFAAFPGRKLYLAGNHDLFVECASPVRESCTSRDKYERLLPVAAAAAGFEYLGLGPVRAGDTAFVGVTGWYDYTLRDPALDVAVHRRHYETGAWRTVRAYDRGHVFWPRRGVRPPAGSHPHDPPGDWAGDVEICDAMLESLATQLRTAAGAARIVAVVHVLPFLELAERGLFGSSSFHDAYLGSSRFGDLLQANERVVALICGHLHRIAERRIGRMHVAARPVGNAARSPLELEALAAECLGVLDLD